METISIVKPKKEDEKRRENVFRGRTWREGIFLSIFFVWDFFLSKNNNKKSQTCEEERRTTTGKRSVCRFVIARA